MSKSGWGYAEGKEEPNTDIDLELVVDENNNEFTIFDPKRVNRCIDKHCWITAEDENSIVGLQEWV